MLTEKEKEERTRLSREAADLFFHKEKNKLFYGEFSVIIERLKELNRKLTLDERSRNINPSILKV